MDEKKMTYKRTLLTKIASFVLAILVVSMYTYSTAYAAAPVIVVEMGDEVSNASENGVENAATKTVSNLRIINLEEPQRYGSFFDNKAIVMTDEGILWEIPVVWVDEEGNNALIYLPGKRYTPVFAFYIPYGVKIAANSGTNSYTIKLPEFLEDYMESDSLFMVSNPERSLTYITFSSILDDSENSDSNELSVLINGTNLLEIYNQSIDPVAYDYTSYVENYYGQTDGTNDYSEGSFTDVSYNQPSESVSAQPVQSDATPSEQAPSKPTPTEPEIDRLVSIHCSQGAINSIGNDNLKYLLDLFINVVEPQAVYLLVTSFPSYLEAAQNNELGKEIGLYVYSSENITDEDRDIEGALAYVHAEYVDDELSQYGYYIGIDADSIFKKDEDTGEYTFAESERNNFYNTVVHELMHAYMDDYNRTGMSGIDDDENKYPRWFKEGISSTIENVYDYRYDYFYEMKYYYNPDTTSFDYTAEALLYYYKNYNEDGERPSIDAENKYYDDADTNTASAYVSGYLATLYLSKLALDYNTSNNPSDTHEALVIEEDGETYYNNKGFLEGLDCILNMLHNGMSLDEVVKEISNDEYSDTADFQNRFIVGENNVTDESLDFCVDFLNYLEKVSDNLQQTNESAYANGSILLPLDTDKTSPISDELPSDIGEQEVYNIADSSDVVLSTVDPDVAHSSGGLKYAGTDADEADGQDTAAKAVEKTDAVSSSAVEELKEDAQTEEDLDAAVSEETQDEENQDAAALEEAQESSITTDTQNAEAEAEEQSEEQSEEKEAETEAQEVVDEAVQETSQEAEQIGSQEVETESQDTEQIEIQEETASQDTPVETQSQPAEDANLASEEQTGTDEFQSDSSDNSSSDSNEDKNELTEVTTAADEDELSEAEG